MKGANQPWMKLYTSLLDYEPFLAMDAESQNLIIRIWLYAARSGLHILPADGKWLQSKLSLDSRPNLKPLMLAADVYGNPKPFLRYCDPPKPNGEQPPEPGPAPEAQGDIAGAAGENGGGQKKSEQNKAEESRGEQKRGEQKRGEQSRTDEKQSTTDSCRGVRSGKSGISQKRTRKKSAKKSKGSKRKAKSKRQEPAEPAEPANPTESDALGRQERPCKAISPHNGPNPAPDSVKPASGHRRKRSLSAAAGAAVYDRHDMQFGRRVFLALQLPGDPEKGAIDETTSFASTWHKIRQGRAPPDEDAMGRRLLKEAASIARKRNVKNKAAAWIYVAVKIASAH